MLAAHSFTSPRRERGRTIPIVAAVIAAAAHIPVTPEHLRTAAYMGILFLLLTAACLLLAIAMAVRDSAAVYAASAVTCGLAVLGYAATRLIAFPMLAEDVGHWFEPLGVISVLSESVVVAYAVRALRQRSTSPSLPQATGKGRG